MRYVLEYYDETQKEWVVQHTFLNQEVAEKHYFENIRKIGGKYRIILELQQVVVRHQLLP